MGRFTQEIDQQGHQKLYKDQAGHVRDILVVDKLNEQVEEQQQIEQQIEQHYVKFVFEQLFAAT